MICMPFPKIQILKTQMVIIYLFTYLLAGTASIVWEENNFI